MELTDEQKAIVAHNLGPALVFAVAGSGKTTAMVYRIERLVRERAFNADSILATSFGRSTVGEIKERLKKWPYCASVTVCTLHSLGNEVLGIARDMRHLDNLQLNEGELDRLDNIIFYRAIKEARRQDVSYQDKLENLDQEDFLGYVGMCKGNLRYSDLTKANLPSDALKVATQAESPKNRPWYLPLYQLYEQIRIEHGWLTFDDMLMLGWEILVRFPRVLAEIRGRYQCVLVDEFQDVNLAQVEILDLITQPHRNYLAIGDDDQTIYEWRGASPNFIREFKDRYNATKYLLSENFRSKAPHLALANKVIMHNKNREPKNLVLTQGFDGATYVHLDDSDEQMGRHIVNEIKSALETGHKPDEVAVLVRLYAQTPYIEHFLIEERIPYRVVGNLPFYQRSEVLTLVNYLRLAVIERDLLSGKKLDHAALTTFGDKWPHVYNKPSRYISRELAEKVENAVGFNSVPISKALLVARAGAKPRVAEKMARFAGDLEWLAGVIDSQPASDILSQLEAKLQYKYFLRETSGFPETGEAKAATVDAFICYAMHKGTAPEFLQHLDYISFNRVGRNLEDESGLVKLMTVFRAKGLEWPVVIVPKCNDGTIPFNTNPNDPARLEEERRLFYVAITRPRKVLHLHINKALPTSPFLVEADFENTLGAVRTMQAALGQDPKEWRGREAFAFAKYTREFHFDRYFKNWWDALKEKKSSIAGKIRSFFRAAKDRKLDEPLGLNPEHEVLWEELAPVTTDTSHPTADEFPELDQLRQKLEPKVEDIPKPVFTRRFPKEAAAPATENRFLKSGDQEVIDRNRVRIRVGDRVMWSYFGEATFRGVVGDGSKSEWLLEMPDGELVTADPDKVIRKPATTTPSKAGREQLF